MGELQSRRLHLFQTDVFVLAEGSGRGFGFINGAEEVRGSRRTLSYL